MTIAYGKDCRKNSGIRAYCAAKKLPVKDVLAWLRVTKPKRDSMESKVKWSKTIVEF